MQIMLKRLRSDAQVPTHGSQNAAGVDLYAVEEIFVSPHKVQVVGTGIAVAIPEGFCGKIYPRSGYSKDWPNYLANNVGIVDADYRGEVLVMIHGGRHGMHVKRGARIAQMLIEPVEYAMFIPTTQLPPTARGEGALGSTGE